MSVGKVLFSVEVEQYENGIVVITAIREDGEKRVMHFPETKIRLFRALKDSNSLIAFILGEK